MIRIEKSFKTTHWSGGTTTELLIYPPESSFANRDFQFRLSMATINDAHSVFTALPEVDRSLMLLDGEIKLAHQGHHEILLRPFQQDAFKGDWHTESFGTATDFNLMTRGMKTYEMHHIALAKNSSKLIDVAPGEKHFFYAWKGAVQLDDATLGNGELAIAKGNCSLASVDDADLVHVVIGE